MNKWINSFKWISKGAHEARADGPWAETCTWGPQPILQVTRTVTRQSGAGSKRIGCSRISTARSTINRWPTWFFLGRGVPKSPNLFLSDPVPNWCFRYINITKMSRISRRLQGDKSRCLKSRFLGVWNPGDNVIELFNEYQKFHRLWRVSTWRRFFRSSSWDPRPGPYY